MVNFNGTIFKDNALFLSHKNSAFTQGDGLVERIRYIDTKLIFWEDHYFNLMASMRMMRMSIPMNFTMEWFKMK